ncbi:MAG: hypothetical protein ISF22_05210 [Methanomassiliicoccus sp.]|nr:hypothetical protein [Methanomassiliicoccus sp.]
MGDEVSKPRDNDRAQRTLFNFDIVDPFEASTIDVFKDQFRRLNGHNPSAADLSSYYKKHPQELARRTGSPGRR